MERAIGNHSSLSVSILVIALMAGCGLNDIHKEETKLRGDSQYGFECTIKEADRKANPEDALLHMTFQTNEESMTAILDMKTIVNSLESQKRIHLRVLNSPPDISRRSETVIYMDSDDTKNSIKYSLDIRIDKKVGHLEFKPGPDSPILKGTCTRTGGSRIREINTGPRLKSQN